MKDKAARWVAAPASTLQGAAAVLGVRLEEDEDVQWIWTHTQEGSYVSGYSIVKRKPDDLPHPTRAGAPR
jgi:hypothetical protein